MYERPRLPSQPLLPLPTHSPLIRLVRGSAAWGRIGCTDRGPPDGPYRRRSAYCRTAAARCSTGQYGRPDATWCASRSSRLDLGHGLAMHAPETETTAVMGSVGAARLASRNLASQPAPSRPVPVLAPQFDRRQSGCYSGSCCCCLCCCDVLSPASEGRRPRPRPHERTSCPFPQRLRIVLAAFVAAPGAAALAALA